MCTHRSVWLTFLCLLAAGSGASGQELPLSGEAQVPLPGVEGYDDAIPTPEEVIGHEIGTRHTESFQVARYFHAVAEASDLAVVHEYARSHQNRPLVHAVVTSAENHESLEEIRQRNVRLTEDAGNVTGDELRDMPAVVQLAYSVHGREASGTEAGILTLYHLTAGQGPAVQELLDDLVILIDPMMNPDGRDRFAHWVNDNRGGVHTTDRQDREHNERWPGGRTNHYWFDLNRDYFPLAHPESRGRVQVYQSWRPQVYTDHHETGRSEATFFFQPGVPERVYPLTPEINQELTMAIGEHHANRFDAIGQTYWTREIYDDFYYGKGSTYPDVQGTVGILYEQRSSRALEADHDAYPHGDLHYARTVRNQFSASLSTLEGALAHREDLLRYQRDFFAAVPERFEDYPTKAYVIDKSEYRTRAQALVENIQHHRVEVHELGQSYESGGRTFEAGEAYVIPLDQPQHKFIRGMMETRTVFPDSTNHDVSAWTMPLTYGTRYAEMQEDPEPYVGAPVANLEFDGGEFLGARDSDVGYVIEWGRYFGPRALYRLQEEGVNVRVVHEAMGVPVDGAVREVPRGSLVIPIDQPRVSREELRALVGELPERDHVRVFGIERGLFPEHPDFGSPSVTTLEKPRVALLTGPGTGMYNAGEVRHLLNERYEMPVTMIDVADVAGADLARYNVLVLSGGSYGGLDSALVREWVRDGGTVIGIESGAAWLNDNGLADLEAHELDYAEMFRDRAWADLEDSFAAQNIEGSIFEAELDTTHPVAYGYSSTAPVFRTMNTFYGRSEEPGTNVAAYTEEPLMTGFLSPQMAGIAGGKASIVARNEGSGQVVLMFDNPNFRSHWHGTNLLFANAIFFGQSF